MLDIGWSEMLLVAVIAIVVIGPKDLPRAMRSVGRWVNKARSVAREFQNSVDQMIAESELDEVRKSVDSIRSFDGDRYLKEQIDPASGKAGATSSSGTAEEERDGAVEPEPHALAEERYPEPAPGNATPVGEGDYVPPQDAADEPAPEPDDGNGDPERPRRASGS
jgi:sec-independent protein translocase protein TatB